MDAIDAYKAELRAVAFAARKDAHGQGLDAAAQVHLAAALAGEVGPVSGYMPIRTEVSPLPVMAALVARGVRVCVPVIMGAGQALRFREWTPDCALEAGPFGAMVPATGDWLEPRCLIVPLVAFDADLNRLGYGAGFYDRSLEGLRAKRPTRAIGYAYGAQELPTVPCGPYDQPLDALVTERGLLAKRGAGA